jgi:hypothetical protein
MNTNQYTHIIKKTDFLMLDTLLPLTLGCLFAIRNDKDMKVYVSYGKNLLTSLNRIVSNLDTAEFSMFKANLETTQIDILSTDSDILSSVSLMRLHCGNYEEQYKRQGYSLYKPSLLVKYKLRVAIRTTRSDTAFFCVELVNSRDEVTLMGAFSTKAKCNNFIDTYYPQNLVLGLYYDDGKDTQVYKREVAKIL